MALTWNAENCPEKDLILGDDEWTLTQGIIFSTMWLGMGEITEKNWKEFYHRTQYGKAMGMSSGVLDGDGEPYEYTPQDIHRRIGLHTNVAYEAPTKFRKRLLESLTESADRKIRKFEKEMENDDAAQAS